MWSKTTPLGTAGAVRLAADLIGSEPFLIISGDALTDLDLTALDRRSHAHPVRTATITLQRVTNPLEFGVVIMDEHTIASRASSKSRRGARSFPIRSTPAFTCLEADVLTHMVKGKAYDFSRDIFPQMLL